MFGNYLELIGTGQDSLNRTPLAQKLRTIITNWDFIKQKSFRKGQNSHSLVPMSEYRMGKDFNQFHIWLRANTENTQRSQENRNKENK